MVSTPIPDDDEERLAALYRYGILDTAIEQGYEDVTALASFICDTPFSTVTLVDRDRQWFKSELGFGSRETKRSESFCTYAVMQPEPLVIPDTLLDARFIENPYVVGDPGIRFYAGAPLIAPGGELLGTVCVFDVKPRELSAKQAAALQALARQVMALFAARLMLVENDRAAAALMQTEKLAAVGRLASTMAHGINNPLEAVTNLLYLSRVKTEDAEIRDWLTLADEELRRVGLIANQSLQFHKQASRAEAVSCGDLLAAALDVYKPRLKNAGITVEKRKRAAEPVVCFEGDIRQVLAHVLTNAIDAMPDGGRLILRSREATDWKTGARGLTLTIADTGSGMDGATVRRAFDAFFSTKGIGGSGLGLWISADIVRRHGGRIALRSGQRAGGSGTVLTIFLPFESVGDVPKV